MNPLLALLHDTSHDYNNIKALVKMIYEDGLTEKQSHYLDLINQCNENLKNRLDKFYTDNKQN